MPLIKQKGLWLKKLEGGGRGIGWSEECSERFRHININKTYLITVFAVSITSNLKSAKERSDKILVQKVAIITGQL